MNERSLQAFQLQGAQLIDRGTFDPLQHTRHFLIHLIYGSPLPMPRLPHPQASNATQSRVRQRARMTAEGVDSLHWMVEERRNDVKFLFGI